MIASHTDRVGTVAAQLAARPAGVPVTIRKTTPSHTVRDTGYKASCHAVDVSGLREILLLAAVYPSKLIWRPPSAG